MEKLKTIVIKGENYVIYDSFNGFAMTNENNFNAYIMNANEITEFKKSNGFETLDDVVNYIKKYCKGVENE